MSWWRDEAGAPIIGGRTDHCFRGLLFAFLPWAG